VELSKELQAIKPLTQKSPLPGFEYVRGFGVFGLPLAAWRGENVGIIFQFFQMLPALSLKQNVILPMDFAKKYTPKERRERAMHLLELVGLAEQAEKLPSMVSGGQQQRAAIAHALANTPALLVGDEPIGNLDARTAGEVFDLFSQLVEQGKTMIMVTHDKELAQRVPRRIEITNGRITRDDYLMILPQRIAVPEMEKSLVFSYALRPTDLKSSFLSKPSLQRNHP